MVKDLTWEAAKNDRLSSELTANLKKCGIEIDQMEVLGLELCCNFRVSLNNPDKVTTCKVEASSNFPGEKIKEALAGLMVDIEKVIDVSCQKSLVEVNAPQKLRVAFNCFAAKLSEFIVCVPVACEAEIVNAERKSFLFIIVQLKARDMSKYREIIEYVLGEVAVELERLDAIPVFLSSKFFASKMPNKRVLIGNYVDWFLKERDLPAAEVLIELSAEKYEGSESEARIYIDSVDVTDIGILDDLGNDYRMIHSENRRMIRKMMEISKEGTIHLYAERRGAGKDCFITKLVKGEKEKGLYIKFFGYLCWSIVCEGKEKIIYERGRYILNSSQSEKEYLTKIETLKDKIDMELMPSELLDWFESDRMRKLIEILIEQKHGTAVILTDCSDEIERLCRLNRGILINKDIGICMENNEWNAKQLLSVTSIDGALFMDLNGGCRAMGVIVDGEARIKGNTGKGARHNSIVNYVRQKGKSNIYLGIIVSEDGMVELTCNLEPED